MKLEEISSLGRSSSSTSCYRTTNIPASRKILPSSAAAASKRHYPPDKSLVSRGQSHQPTYNPSNTTSPALSLTRLSNTTRSLLSALLRSLTSTLPTTLPSTRRFSLPASTTPSLGRKVTGTLFGHRKGHVTFAVQEDPASSPALLVELATSTSSLVKEMSSGLVRIALECQKNINYSPTAGRGGRKSTAVKLFSEPVWTMYCNGRKCGYATTRDCTESDCYVLGTIRSVSVGAGVIPASEYGKFGEGGDGGGGRSATEEGELLYMRARFERVVGSRDSEAFYMLNPDGNGGPDLSIFLLRL